MSSTIETPLDRLLDPVARCFSVDVARQLAEICPDPLLIGAKSGDECRLAGAWTLLGDAGVSVKLQKGDTLPTHDHKPPHWRITERS